MGKKEIISRIIGTGFNEEYQKNSSITLLQCALENYNLKYEQISEEITKLCGEDEFAIELQKFFINNKHLRYSAINKLNSLCAKNY